MDGPITWGGGGGGRAYRRMFTVSNLGRKNNILEHILSFLCSVSKLASRCNEPIKTKKIKHR